MSHKISNHQIRAFKEQIKNKFEFIDQGLSKIDERI